MRQQPAAGLLVLSVASCNAVPVAVEERRRPRKCCPVILRSIAWEKQTNHWAGRRRESRLPLHLALGSCRGRYAASPALPRAIHLASQAERIRELDKTSNSRRVRVGMQGDAFHLSAPFRSTAGRTGVTPGVACHDWALSRQSSSEKISSNGLGT
ncbi:hypothetical protein BDW71DRAFT_49636 [Aspergillus fruticulosus]